MAQQRFHHLGPPAHMRRKPVLLLTESPKQTRLVNLFQNSKIHGSALCPLAMWCIQKRKEKSQDIWQTWSNQIQLRLKKVVRVCNSSELGGLNLREIHVDFFILNKQFYCSKDCSSHCHHVDTSYQSLDVYMHQYIQKRKISMQHAYMRT